MNTTAPEADGRRRRRRHSAEFKAGAVAACLQPGVSIAAVALSRGLNANLLRRWVAQCEGYGHSGGAIEPACCAAQAAQAAPAFVPLALPPSTPAAAPDIRIELRRGSMAISVTWPSSAAAECASWMRELLR